MRALLFDFIDITDRNQPATAICGVCVVGLLICLGHAWGWL